MLDRKHIEHLLTANGLSPTSPDEEIRSILISAKWTEDDVQTALIVLRENTETNESRVDTMHNVFRSDQKLSPESIQSLLGIDVEISSKELQHARRDRQNYSFWQVLIIIGFAIVLAFSSILLVMYLQEFGVFHPSV